MKKIVSFGCSFTEFSHNYENSKRKNKTVIESYIIPGEPEGETSFTFVAANNLNTTYENYAYGGSGVRSAIYKMLYYAKTNPIDNVYFVVGVSLFGRFDFIKPFSNIRTYPSFPKEEYARYYDEKSAEFELLTLIEMAGIYLTKKNIPHVFINTCNNYYSTKDIVNTFIFPNNDEYWQKYIQSYDDSYNGNHPNFNDHVILGKLLADYMKPNNYPSL